MRPAADAVALYLSDPTRTYASVAKDLGVNRETLRLWVRQARAAGQTAGDARRGRMPRASTTASEVVLEQENKQLRARVRELELERDILCAPPTEARQPATDVMCPHAASRKVSQSDRACLASHSSVTARTGGM
jgi:transposase